MCLLRAAFCLLISLFTISLFPIALPICLIFLALPYSTLWFPVNHFFIERIHRGDLNTFFSETEMSVCPCRQISSSKNVGA